MKTGWVPKDALGQWWMYEHGQVDGRGLPQVVCVPPYPDKGLPKYPGLRAAAVAAMQEHPENFETIPRDNDWLPEERLTAQEMP